MNIIFEYAGKEIFRLEQIAGHQNEIPTLGDSVEVPVDNRISTEGVKVLRVRGRKFILFKNNISSVIIFLGA